jgi:Fe2+ transport system protein FeoA
MRERATPLAQITGGRQATVVALRGGGKFQERAAGMGLYVGCVVEVLIGGDGGRMLLATGDTRITMGHGMAESVMVRVLP